MASPKRTIAPIPTQETSQPKQTLQAWIAELQAMSFAAFGPVARNRGVSL